MEHDAYSLSVPLHIRADMRLEPIEIYVYRRDPEEDAIAALTSWTSRMKIHSPIKDTCSRTAADRVHRIGYR